VASACGGGGTKAASGSPTTTTATGASRTGGSGTFAAARAKFTSCLESKGVPANIASQTLGFGRRAGGAPPSTGSSTTRPTVPSQYQAAFQSCRSLLPTGFGAVNATQLRAYEQCLEIHGVPVPTTTPTTAGSGAPAPGGGGFGRLGSLRNNPAYASAFQACATLLPARTGTGSPTSAPPSS
jgi:hypothetical protein